MHSKFRHVPQKGPDRSNVSPRLGGLIVVGTAEAIKLGRKQVRFPTDALRIFLRECEDVWSKKRVGEDRRGAAVVVIQSAIPTCKAFIRREMS